jgi:hypothetical protein
MDRQLEGQMQAQQIAANMAALRAQGHCVIEHGEADRLLCDSSSSRREGRPRLVVFCERGLGLLPFTFVGFVVEKHSCFPTERVSVFEGTTDPDGAAQVVYWHPDRPMCEHRTDIRRCSPYISYLVLEPGPKATPIWKARPGTTSTTINGGGTQEVVTNGLLLNGHAQALAASHQFAQTNSSEQDS